MENTSIVSQGDLNTRVDAAREQVDAWLAAKLGRPIWVPITAISEMVSVLMHDYRH